MKMLAVRKAVANYVSYYEVTYASTFEEAKEKIIEAELNNTPFDDLDLPVYNINDFWAFIDWLESTNRYYAFSIYGTEDYSLFEQICNIARNRGFHFND